jgi:cation:H+ antiporter
VIYAEKFALSIGISEVVVGLTILALGTSLPELAATVSAIFKGKNQMVIGNIIGSNIMNIVAVLGFTLLIKPIQIEFSDMIIQGLFMVILTIGLFVLLKLKGGITKLYAWVLIFIYILFLYFNFQEDFGSIL